MQMPDLNKGTQNALSNYLNYDLKQQSTVDSINAQFKMGGRSR